VKADRDKRLDVDEADENGDQWREFGLRNALAHMPQDSPGRAVIEALLARGRLGPEDERRLRARGLRTALANMPPDSPGRAVVESLLARESDADVPPPSRVGREAPDLVEQLERLAALRESGHLSDAEFEAAKKALLA
jgi:Short C-terminal domain